MKLTDHDSIILTYEMRGTKTSTFQMPEEAKYGLLMGPMQSWYPTQFEVPSYIFIDDKGKRHEFNRNEVPNVELNSGDKFSARRHFMKFFKRKIVLSEELMKKLAD
jgi:hypothetical protein